jgi:phosphodiesterase/alkaline phosphatase D-like protein
MSKYFNSLVLAVIGLIFFLIGITTTAVTTNQGYNKSAEKEWILVGGVSSTSATFRVRSVLAATSVSVGFVLSEQEELSNPILKVTLGDNADTTDKRIFDLNATALSPQTTYYYATIRTDQSENSLIRNGRFQTPAIEGQAFSFKIATAGCAWTGSESDVFRQVAKHDPLFLLHLGDFHYEDIATNDMNKRLEAVDIVMGSNAQRELFRQVPLAYIWDDHDWLGNDSGEAEKDSGARETALKSYQLAFPHHPLALNGDAVPIYHAFTIGTVRFILTDLRSEANETHIYSDEQRDWLYQELSAADQYDFVIWASSKPWIGKVTLGEDNWAGQPEDRQQLSDIISTTLAQSQNLLAVSSDSHMVAFDDGSNTYYGRNSSNGNDIMSFPILQSGPFDRLGSAKGGPFSDGCHTVEKERNHQYAIISFEADTGGEPCLEITTYDQQEVVMNRKLCGKIFQKSAPGTGSCSAQNFRSESYAMLGVVIALWILLTMTCCYFMNPKRGSLISIIVLVFVVATLLSALVPLASGIVQWDVRAVLIIAVVQMIVSSFYVGVWSYSTKTTE